MISAKVEVRAMPVTLCRHPPRSPRSPRSVLRLYTQVDGPDGEDTPMHAAAARGHTKIVRLLLQNGANARTRNQMGQTALHLACRYGHTGETAGLCGCI